MLRALFESGIKPDIISGSSAGAVNAAWVALYPEQLDDLERVWRGLRTSDVFPGSRFGILLNLTRRGCMHLSRSWEKLLRREFGHARFEDAVVPCAVYGVDLQTGTRKVFESGEIVPALMASTAIPGIFPPYVIDGQSYVDGGVLEVLPVDVLLERGANPIYALDCSWYPTAAGVGASSVDRSNRIAARDAVTRVVSAAASRTASVHLLQPELPEFADARDFSHTAELVQAGYDHTRAFLDSTTPTLPRASSTA